MIISKKATMDSSNLVVYFHLPHNKGFHFKNYGYLHRLLEMAQTLFSVQLSGQWVEVGKAPPFYNIYMVFVAREEMRGYVWWLEAYDVITIDRRSWSTNFEAALVTCFNLGQKKSLWWAEPFLPMRYFVAMGCQRLLLVHIRSYGRACPLQIRLSFVEGLCFGGSWYCCYIWELNFQIRILFKIY